MRGWRATRPHPSRRLAGRVPGGQSRNAAARRYTRRACPRRPPSPSWGGGRRPRRRSLASASTAEKDAALLAAADLLVAAQRPRSSPPTRLDLDAAEADGMEAGPLDRLRLTDARIAGMADGLRDGRRAARPGGRGARRVAASQRSPDRAASGCRSAWSRSSTRTGPTSRATPPGICLKSGNVGAPARLGHRAAVQPGRSPTCCATASTKAGLPADCVLLVDDVRHEAAVELMQLTDVVDCLIPRGGPALIQSIRDHATVPVIIDGDGNCHVYVDAVRRPRRARSTSW